MTGLEQTISDLARDGCNAVQISEALGLPVENVTQVLTIQQDARASTIGSDIAGMKDLAISAMKRILTYGESESAVARVAELVVDHELGLKVPPKSDTNITVIFNQQLSERLEKVAIKRREMTNGSPVVDVESRVLAA